MADMEVRVVEAEEKPWTHSIVIQVTTPEIKSQAATVQESVVKYDPELSQYKVKPEQLHITLAMLKIADDEGVKHAVQCLDEVKANGIEFHLEGVDTFQPLVLYAKVNPKPQDAFKKFKAGLDRRLEQCSKIKVDRTYKLKPHMSLIHVEQHHQYLE